MIWSLERIKTLLFLYASFISVEAVAGHPVNDRYVQLVEAPIESSISKSFENINKLIAAGKSGIAEKIIRKHLVRYPHDADYLIVLSRILYESGKSVEAIEMLERARTYSKKYEDIYLLEAGILNSLSKFESCKRRDALVQDYYKNTAGVNSQIFEQRVGEIKGGKNDILIGSYHDRLNNNRGTWDSSIIQGKWENCSGNSVYIGYNTVERYGLDDAEVIVGGGWEFERFGLELEYRDAQEANVLAQQSWYGMVSIGTTWSTDVLLTGSFRKYTDVETGSLGMGVDYYFGNYELMLIRSRAEYIRDGQSLDSAYTNQYRLGYYYTKQDYIRFGYISGKELSNDGSPNPPYSRTKTIILTGSLELTGSTYLLAELKRHYQSGYYEQNGFGITLRFKY